MAWPRSTILLLFAAAGCAGQNVEGAWRGPFPLNGVRECELRLQSNRSVTLQCDGTAVVAAGRYEWDGARLVVRLSAFTRDGVKAAPPEALGFKVQGEGNTLRAAYQGELYEWKRFLK